MLECMFMVKTAGGDGDGGEDRGDEDENGFVGGVLGSERVDGLHDHLRVGRQRSGHWISMAVVVGGSGWSLNATVTARTYSDGCMASMVR